MSDEVREKVGKNSEQRQPADAISRQNPSSAAFMLANSSSRRGRLIINSRNDRGPIFHAKPSNGKIVAQKRYASRLPRIVAKQDYLGRILRRIRASGSQNCDQDHGIISYNNYHYMIIPLPVIDLLSALGAFLRDLSG
jgi:hypothetical protein